jgi:hypothetical protein
VRRAVVVGAVLAAAACGGDASVGPGTGSSPTPAPTPVETSVRQWVAVFDTAAHPDHLDPSTEELLDSAGGHIAVQPVQCWDGLAADLEVDPGLYAAAVIATSEHELEGVVEGVDRDPIGTGEYEAFCLG